FIMQALKGDDITIFGDGSQSRSFCYCDDLIDGFLRLMESPAELTGPVNLGNPGEFTMLELAETILDLTGSSSEIVHRPLPQDDPRQRRPDISVAQRELGWEPKVALRDGLEPTIRYFDALIRAGHA
ncbi:MAG: NAD-dependent epimerase/dehydratase family protein, partial [Ilumatobacter fluminis]